jgi:hypothetical protein
MTGTGSDVYFRGLDLGLAIPPHWSGIFAIAWSRPFIGIIHVDGRDTGKGMGFSHAANRTNLDGF